MKKSSLVFLLLSMFFFEAFSQENTSRIKPLAGTYQITVASSKTEILIAEETLFKIEELRDENTDKNVKFSDFVIVFIPSKKTINSGTFKPLVEYIYE